MTIFQINIDSDHLLTSIQIQEFPNEDFLLLFLTIELRLWVWERTSIETVTASSLHITATREPYNLLL